MQTIWPVSLVVSQDTADYVPTVNAAGWNPWGQHHHWVIEADMDAGVWCRLRRRERVGAPFRWQAGTWHLYAPGTGYQIRYDHPAHRHRNLWLIFDVRCPLPILDRRPFAVFADPHGVIRDMVADIHRNQQQGLIGAEFAKSGALTMIISQLLLATRTGAGTPKQPWCVSDSSAEVAARASGHRRGADLLTRVDAVLSGRLSRPPLVPELARQLGLSVSSLAHRLREESGWSVVQRIRWLRVREAQARLAHPDLQAVKSIALDLGFSSPQFFARVFRRVVGLSPEEFRAKHHRGTVPG